MSERYEKERNKKERNKKDENIEEQNELQNRADKYTLLRDVFGYGEFKKGQEELIDAALNKQDVVGIMPTGAGKSICYQIPALLFSGITIVVSPLISLMMDQVKALNQAGVHAAYINSSLTEQQFHKAMTNACEGRYKIIYVAPERLMTPAFLKICAAVEISMLAVDEAHCISHWGQDFRPSYLHIVDFINQLSARPVVVAYTATATQIVREDIIYTLGLGNAKIAITGFDRENLYFEVRKPVDKDKELLAYLQKHENESGIIYCNTRKHVDAVHEMLRNKGYLVGAYHAGLSDMQRKQNQEDFIYDRTQLIVATNAFGMGIDKSNVRYIVHYNMPKDMESYYQEAGRAGRDGDAAQCVIFYSGVDVKTNEFLIDLQSEKSEFDEETMQELKERDRERLKQMTYYCFTNECLRGYILKYFGERPSNYCDNCFNCLTEFEETDVTQASADLINLILTSGERYGLVAIADAAYGSQNVKVKRFGLDKNDYYAKLSHFTITRIRQILSDMMVNEYVVVTNGDYPVLQVLDKGRDFVKSDERTMLLKLPKEIIREKTKVAKSAKSKGIQTHANPTLFEQLRQKRLEYAKATHMPPYIIFNDKTLNEMCALLPVTREEMLSISGVGLTKYEKYGVVFMEIVREYADSL